MIAAFAFLDLKAGTARAGVPSLTLFWEAQEGIVAGPYTNRIGRVGGIVEGGMRKGDRRRWRCRRTSSSSAGRVGRECSGRVCRVPKACGARNPTKASRGGSWTGSKGRLEVVVGLRVEMRTGGCVITIVDCGG